MLFTFLAIVHDVDKTGFLTFETFVRIGSACECPNSRAEKNSSLSLSLSFFQQLVHSIEWQLPNSRRNNNLSFNWVYVFSGVSYFMLITFMAWTMKAIRLKLLLFFGCTENVALSAYISESRNSLTLFLKHQRQQKIVFVNHQMPMWHGWLYQKVWISFCSDYVENENHLKTWTERIVFE